MLNEHRKARTTIVTIKDYETLAVFLEDMTGGVFPKSLWLDRFDLWWEKNPAMNEGLCRGWILNGNNGEIAGFLGNIPVRYFINGREEIACCITSWYVRENYRNRSLELFIPFLKQPGRRLLLSTTPSDPVFDISVRVGFHNFEKEWLKKDYFYTVNIFDFIKYATDRLFARRVALVTVKSLGMLLAPFLKMFQWISRSLLTGGRKEYSFSEIFSFSEQYSLLWEEIKKRYDILAVRDAEALNWFFFGSKGLLSSRHVLEISRNGVLKGYVAAKMEEIILKGKVYHFLEVVDIILAEESAALPVVLEGLLWLAQNNRVTAIRINPFVAGAEKDILKFGFLMWKGKARVQYKYSDGNSIAKENFKNGFYATPLDGDRCFFP